ncbi:MAG TPA: hypothetical protein DCF62_10140 [Porticoccaceae bacterium]|nr:hypothetical protein [Porticoccaceae bacterium]HCO58830.1 hypothetical protein [Porticoccaceae bacterium]
MSDLLWMIPLMVLLIGVKAFFSGSEIALVSSDKIRLRHRASQGDRKAAAVLKVERRPELTLATTLVGTNVSIVALTTLATILMSRLLGGQSEIWAVLIFSPIFLILTEVVPKSVFQQNADKIAPLVVTPLRIFMLAIFPIVYGFATIARFAARIVGGKGMRHVSMTREVMRAVLDDTDTAGDVSPLTWSRLRKAFQLTDVSVGEVMIPLAEMTTLNTRDSTAAAIALACGKGHFRLPVYDDQAGSITGVVALDVWKLMQPGIAESPLQSLIHEPEFVVAQQPVYELLPILKRRQDRMAIVLGEFGSAIGMVTLEDIQEEVLGDFVGVGYNVPGYVHRTKHGVRALDNGVYELDGRVSISQVNDLLAMQLPSKESHTIGGFVTAELRHLPVVDETVDASGYRFRVVEATGRFVKTIHAEPL